MPRGSAPTAICFTLITSISYISVELLRHEQFSGIILGTCGRAKHCEKSAFNIIAASHFELLAGLMNVLDVEHSRYCGNVSNTNSNTAATLTATSGQRMLSLLIVLNGNKNRIESSKLQGINSSSTLEWFSLITIILHVFYAVM